MTTQIELPRDAEGREIQLDTKVLYDYEGEELHVTRIEFDPFKCEWFFAVREWTIGLIIIPYRPQFVYLENPVPPDSWEKLEEDLVRATANDDTFNTTACAYMNRSGDMCSECKFCDNRTRRCSSQMAEDIASRIRKLRGED